MSDDWAFGGKSGEWVKCYFIHKEKCGCDECNKEWRRVNRSKDEIQEYANQVIKGLIEPGKWL